MQAAEAAQSWRSKLPRARRCSSDWRGLAIFARGALLYVALFAGMFVFPAWWLRLLCAASMPLAIGALFVMGHDAGHLTLTRSARLNRILGRMAMLPSYHPFTSWLYAHNVLHHGGTCLKQKQPDFPPMSKDEFDALPRWRRGLEIVYRSPLGVGLCYAVDFYCRHLLFPRRRKYSFSPAAFHLDRLLVLAFLGVQYAAACRLAPARPIYAAAAVIVPWVVWIGFMGMASFVQHTNPRTIWYDDEAEWNYYDVQLRSSTHMVLPWPAGAILHNIMDHPAHHIDPTIPLYELPASQRLLEQCAPEYSVVSRLTIREYQRICRTCKLYDYRRHCWLDFAGNQTSPSL